MDQCAAFADRILLEFSTATQARLPVVGVVDVVGTGGNCIVAEDSVQCVRFVARLWSAQVNDVQHFGYCICAFALGFSLSKCVVASSGHKAQSITLSSFSSCCGGGSPQLLYCVWQYEY